MTAPSARIDEPTRMQAIACTLVALLAWAIAWVIAHDLQPGNESVNWLFGLAGVAVLAGTTVRFGGGLTLSAVLMTGGSLLVGWDLDPGDQLGTLALLGLLISTSVAAQALAQHVGRDRPVVSSSLVLARTGATLVAAISGAAITTLVVQAVTNRSLSATVIPAGLLLVAVGLFGARRSWRSGTPYGAEWIPAPPGPTTSPLTGDRSSRTLPLSRTPPPPPLVPPPPPTSWR